MDSIEWLLHDSALTLAALGPICVGWNFGLSDKGLKRRPTLRTLSTTAWESALDTFHRVLHLRVLLTVRLPLHVD
jgi:hypothetical protein